MLTDFGLDDNYVGVMKGVIASIAPHARLIDITHNIQAQNIPQAAFVLHNSYKYFPKNSIFLVVVDPGVGTDRKPLIVQADDYYFVAPDNGVLSYIFESELNVEAREISNPKLMLNNVSNTFHGRDIFAPAAAHLANGVSFKEFGDIIPPDSLVKPDNLFAEVGESKAIGRVMEIDFFGNIITNIKISEIENKFDLEGLIIIIGGVSIKGFYQTYNGMNDDRPHAIAGSFGYLEIAIKNSNAAEMLKVSIGNEVILRKDQSRSYD